MRHPDRVETLYRVFSLMLCCRSCTLLQQRIVRLDVITFLDGTLVTAQPSFGELVDALVGTGSTGLDHVQNASFVR